MKAADLTELNRDQRGVRTGFLFTMLFLLYMFDYIDREVVSGVISLMKADLGITDTQAGLLGSAVYLGIVIFAFPVSILVDRWSRKRSIGIMVVLWSIATGVAAFIKTFPQLLLTRLGVGIGEAGYSPGGTAMVSAMYPREKRSRMMGLWNASIPLGSAIGVAVGGLIGSTWGWKHAFGLVAIPGFILGIVFFFFVRDYKTVKLEKPGSGTRAAEKMKLGEIIRQFVKTPSLLLTYIGFAGNTFLSTAYLYWLPTYFNRIQGIPNSQAGLKASSVMVLAIIGFPLGGFLADAWMRKRNNARPLFAGLASIVSAGIFFVAFGLLGGALQYLTLMLGALLTVTYLSAASAVTQDVVHPGLWAVSWSFCVIVQNAAGSMLAPTVVGSISDGFGLSTAMLVVPFTSLAAGLLFLLASLFYARDVERAVKVKVEMEM
jgi:MFS family permease